MMYIKRSWWLSSIFLVISLSASACDICGCYAGNIKVGLLNQVNSEYLNLAYGQTTFRGSGDLSYDRDVFRVVQLSWQKFFSDRWSVYAEQGFRWNRRINGESIDGVHGLSNALVQLNYRLLKESTERGTWVWRIGSSIKLPTGRYIQNIHDQNLPENFNPSDGSWGFGVSSDLLWSRENDGMILNTDYRYSFDDPGGYQMGASLTGQMAYYRNLEIKDVVCMPYLGVMAEWVDQNKYANGREVSQSGGHGVFASLGMNIDMGTYNFGIAYQLPLLHGYGQDQIKAAGRFQVQATYLFN